MNAVQRRLVLAWSLIALGYILGFVFHRVLGSLLPSGIGWLMRSSCPTAWHEMSPRWHLLCLVLFVAAVTMSVLCTYFPLPWLLWVRPVLEPLFWCPLIAMVLVVEWRSFRRAGRLIA